MGAEGDGLSRRALASADTIVTIPMSHSVDSLNVASAAAVALYALRAPAVAAGQTSQRRPPSGDA
jgi:tRNA G18 (ribose-2'-O)-methylase SpoU